MALTQEQVSQLYVALFGRASEGAGNKGWIDKGLNQVETANEMIASDAAKDYFGGELTNLDFVTFIYANTLGFTHDEEGIANWTAKLDAGISRGELVVDMITAALSPEFEGSAPQNQLLNRIEVSNYMATNVENVAPENVASTQFVSERYPDAGLDVTDSASTLTAAEKIIDEMKDAPVPVPGEEYSLEVTQDKITGTAKDDLFIADVVQNQNGAQVNTLGSGDIINGGAGNDTLDATLIAAYNVAGKAMDITPTTKSVENIIINAQISDNNPEAAAAYVVANANLAAANANLTAAKAAGTPDAATIAAAQSAVDVAQAQVDALAGAAGDLVVLNARKMNGVEKISSKESDADLLVKNMTTNGVTGGTAAQTVEFAYSGNRDSKWSEADMTVFYDQDYLTRSSQEINALDLTLVNAINNAEGENPVEGFKAINFKVGNVDVSVDVSDIAEKTTGISSIYQDVANKINAKLDELGLDTVKATVLPETEVFFSINIPPFSAGSSAGFYNPIRITNLGEEALVGETIETSKLDYKTELNGVFNEVDTENNDTPVSINVDLEKVGLAGNGGALVIGSMNKSSDNKFDAKESTTDTVAGFDEFNVTVKGDKSKNSSLSALESTNNTLRKVTIDSKAGSTANLTIGNVNTNTAFGAAETLITDSASAANAFKDVQVMDASAFKGDLTLNAGITDEIIAKYLNNDDVTLYGLNDARTEVALFDYKGGSGNDELNIFIDEAALAKAFADTTDTDANTFKMNINGGAGNDEITVTFDDASALVTSIITNISINGGAGNDIIDISDALGAGAGDGTDATFVVEFNGNFGHDEIIGFNVGAVAVTNEVQSLDLTDLLAHAGETINVSVGDKAYSYTIASTSTTAQADALGFIEDILKGEGTTTATNDKDVYFGGAAAITAGVNALTTAAAPAGKNDYVGENIGTVKVEVLPAGHTAGSYDATSPIHSFVSTTTAQGGLFNGTGGTDVLDFSAYNVKGGVIVGATDATTGVVTASGTAVNVDVTELAKLGTAFIYLEQSVHDTDIYNAYLSQTTAAGTTTANLDFISGNASKGQLLGSINLQDETGLDIDVGTLVTTQLVF
ncbi:DUF4214 domain-containing protein [Aliarcobacter cryaerophilus]|uniref:DUF4214 domain-containing protein n=1 Tax=Aliarcobacter cryaerophilus TaxID=28198 RepID=A0A2S9SQ09_9BACT|nr:DUF4214 domain-containing protein [Aliarcobacter cryaerophilus]PRM88652.1 hypothetical protein CJ669_03205 [Aliarcobacter cryaerophilus]